MSVYEEIKTLVADISQDEMCERLICQLIYMNT